MISIPHRKLALVVTTQNGEQLYEISRGGEDTGVGSRASFSRKKSRLEDAELITTTKVSVEIGRPRQELHVTDNSVSSQELPELVAEAQSAI